MTAQGNAAPRYRRADSDPQSIFLAELAAREMGHVPLFDALGLLELYARGEQRSTSGRLRDGLGGSRSRSVIQRSTRHNLRRRRSGLYPAAESPFSACCCISHTHADGTDCRESCRV